METKWLTNTHRGLFRGLQVAFRSFDHAVIFRRRPQSRRRIEPNVKEENDAWKYHFKWRNSREKLERKVKAGMMDIAIQFKNKINLLCKKLSACTKKVQYMIFKFFSLKHCFSLWKYAFCKRYLTCTINMPSILKAMLEYHIGNPYTTFFLIWHYGIAPVETSLSIKCLLLFVGGNWWNIVIVVETIEKQMISERSSYAILKPVAWL